MHILQCRSNFMAQFGDTDNTEYQQLMTKTLINMCITDNKIISED